MSADEYASKELQQWRKAEAAKDIEAIKTHELDMLALGNTFVMKSHKGEQVIEKSEADAVSSSTSEAVLPENQAEILEAEKISSLESKKSSDDAKSSRKKSKKSDRDRDRHRHSSSSKSHSHSSSSSSHKDKKSSRDKDKHSSSSSSSKSDSKKHHSSSKSSSSSKSRSSSDKKEKEDRKKHSSGSSSLSKSSSGDKVAEAIRQTDTSVSSPSTSELDELQARINKATAAIEAAKKSVASLSVPVPNNPQEEEPEEVSQGLDDEEEAPGSPLDLDLPDLSTEPQVSSTVTIPTPEQSEAWSAPEEPSVWKGQVMMQDVAKFSVSAFQVSGTSDYLSVDLKSSLELVGRIPPSVCWDYINKIGKNPTKEIIVLKLSPSNDDEKDNYQSFFTYLNSRDRFGVVGNCNKNVKDCYIMPLGSAQAMPPALLPMSGQGLPETRPDLLLTIIVRNRRTRPNDPIPSTSLPFKQTPSTSVFPPARPKILPSLPPPLLPPTLPSAAAADDDNAPYSPGSSPEELGGGQAPSGDLSLAEKLARLQAEVAAKKAALAMREQENVPAPEPRQPPGGFFEPSQNVGMYQQTMPPQAPPIHPPPFISTSANQPPFPFPVANKPPMGGGSSLSRMSDADLLAAAAAMEQPPVKRTLPPPGKKTKVSEEISRHVFTSLRSWNAR